VHANTNGTQLEYIFTVSLGKVPGAQGYAKIHMAKIEHVYNMHIGLLLSFIGCKIWSCHGSYG
jgi:hypothetical protein